MARTVKIDSNSVGFRIALEDSLKVLPVTPDWDPKEPNSFTDIGGEFTLVARNPINPSAQNQKGVITDVDASFGYQSDVTQENLQGEIEGFMFADFIRKGEEDVTLVEEDGINPDEYQVASTTGFLQSATLGSSLIKGKGFTNPVNNALNLVEAIVVDTSVEVATGQLLDETPVAGAASIVVVGHQFSADDIDVDVAGSFPALVSTLADFTTLGLSIGEAIFIGGDTPALNAFSNVENSGFATIRTIAAQRIEFDKTDQAFVAETSSGSRTIQIFFGRFIKNQQPALIVRRTYQAELDLGKGDDTFPTNQTIYIVGGLASELAMNLATADKLTADYTFIGLDSEERDGSDSDDTVTGQAPKAGTRPSLVSGDAFNTSSDFSRIKLAVRDDANSAPVPLVGFHQNIVLNINNNVTPEKAISVRGACGVSRGNFQVGATFTSYFGSVEIQRAIGNNSDVTLDYAVVKNNAGFFIDIPLGSLGEGKVNPEQNSSITVPITLEAATAASVDPNLDHTLAISFYDYLPSLADS